MDVPHSISSKLLPIIITSNNKLCIGKFSFISVGQNICLVALYGENALSYTDKGEFSNAQFVVGGDNDGEQFTADGMGHIHGISNELLSDTGNLDNMGFFCWWMLLRFVDQFDL
jgi:hypothetical protein